MSQMGSNDSSSSRAQMQMNTETKSRTRKSAVKKGGRKTAKKAKKAVPKRRR